METRLDKAYLGKVYTIVNLQLDDPKMTTRLKELGFISGNEIVVKAISPHRKTIIVALLGSMFALKTNIAKEVVIK